MKIEFYKKTVYGNELSYIKDPALAKGISELTGKKSVTDHEMSVIAQLFDVEFVQVMYV